MPRRTHPLLLAATFATGLLLALGVAACGGGGSDASATLDTPPLTVGTGATLPSSTSTSTTTTGTTTSSTATTDSSADSGGASDSGSADTSGDTGAATGGDTSGGTTGDTGADTGGGGAATGGGGTTTPATPANPGGAAPDYQSFCNENPGAC